ncbi:uncharacterized protein NMK_2460 [Novimethylophilus kurashikiensis]|uniref:Uncharacterized protein n=1 Tax=Novimethylophilus kurashikiensis TaxID=1825523 RepID=A0A2R5FAL2_9PROT|nr:hypothetical protein [Novimethylophilus kurashikiensis]GBG14859.1 uncharacterized protein NMK_2460 [Novimethylophilus kurashikiensis]
MANKTITPAFLKILREEVNEALKGVAEKHGIQISAGHASYTETTFTLKLEGLVEGGLSREAQIYEASHGLYGLPPLNTELTLGKDVFVIKGMKARGTKCILLEKKADGKEFVGTIDQVLKALPKKDS